MKLKRNYIATLLLGLSVYSTPTLHAASAGASVPEDANPASKISLTDILTLDKKYGGRIDNFLTSEDSEGLSATCKEILQGRRTIRINYITEILHPSLLLKDMPTVMIAACSCLELYSCLFKLIQTGNRPQRLIFENLPIAVFNLLSTSPEAQSWPYPSIEFPAEALLLKKTVHDLLGGDYEGPTPTKVKGVAWEHRSYAYTKKAIT